MWKDFIKKADLILLAVLIVVGLAASLFVARSGHADGNGMVVIYSGGEEYGRYFLNKDQTITVDSKGGRNVVKIKEGAVIMESADCHNQDCVHHKAIDSNHESIICLPHKVVVEIESEKESQYDTLAQ